MQYFKIIAQASVVSPPWLPLQSADLDPELRPFLFTNSKLDTAVVQQASEPKAPRPLIHAGSQRDPLDKGPSWNEVALTPEAPTRVSIKSRA